MVDLHRPAKQSVDAPRQGSRKQVAPANVAAAPVAPGSKQPVRGKGLPLPHEHDESPGSGKDAPRRVMLQARRDLAAGMVDTDMRATPGLDQERRAALVPGAGGKPLKVSVR